jgi:hypothetical protein
MHELLQVAQHSNLASLWHLFRLGLYEWNRELVRFLEEEALDLRARTVQRPSFVLMYCLIRVYPGLVWMTDGHGDSSSCKPPYRQ